MMRIAVFGLGYVGCVSAACFAKEGHSVIGVDIAQNKVDIVNSGKNPIVEPRLGEILSESVMSGNLTATTDFRSAIKESEVSLICVGTPSNPNGSLKLDYVFKVAEEIGSALKDSHQYHVFVIRSTVLPGTMAKATAILESSSGKRVGSDFGVCSNPEFLREGSAVKDFYNPPYTIVGEYDQKCGDILQKVYAFLDVPMIRIPIKLAEMVKYANNAFHAVKVVFANEMGTLAKENDVDGHKLMEIVCRDTKLNLSPYYMKPGFAFGGSCLPKDVRAISYQGKSLDVELPLLNSLLASNQAHINRAINVIKSFNTKKISILGISFKSDTDDLRESPIVELAEQLLGKGFQLKIFDHNVQLARIFGANREYINEKIPHISSLLTESQEEIVEHGDVLVVGNKDGMHTAILEERRPDSHVVDLVRLYHEIESLPETYHGICW
jgi:GDP-mannose 6-dehydrogenase